MKEIDSWGKGTTGLMAFLFVVMTFPSADIRAEENPSSENVRPKFSHIHISLIPGYFFSHGVNDFAKLFENIGFSDDKSYSGGFGLGPFAHVFPDINYNQKFSLADIRIDYSLSKNMAVGFSYSYLGGHGVDGRREVGYYVDTILHCSYKGDAYLVTASYMPIPDGYLQRASVRLTGGIGFSKAKIGFSSLDDENYEEREFSPKAPCLLALAEYSIFFGRYISIGLSVDYKYIPVNIQAFQIHSFYCYVAGPFPSEIIHSSVLVNIPEHRANLGGLRIGAALGVHF